MNTRKKVAVVFAFVIMAVIFGIFAYLVIKMENEKNHKPNVASLTDAGTKLVSVNDYISTEVPTTEEITTEEPTTQQITTEATTEKVTEAPTTEVTTEEVVYEEDYISDDYEYTYEDTYDYSGYEEESSGEGEADSYSEPEVEETNDYISEDSNDGGMSYYTSSWTTAYAWTDNTCADGRYPECGYTAASSDPNLWYKWIYIEGVGEFFVHDHCPNGGVIDIYMGDEGSCWEYGSSVRDIYIIDR